MNTIRRFFRIVYGVSVLIVVLSAATGAAYVTGNLPEKVRLEEIEKIIHVPEPEPTLNDVLQDAPSYGIPVEVARVLLEQEDAGQYRKNAIRCEWGSEEWLAIANKLEPKDKQQRDALRCSYGPFQVAGWHAPKYGMVWSDLLNIRNNAEVAAAVWGDCKEQSLKKNVGADTWTHYRTAFRCYNGSGPRAEQYADRAMAKLAKIALDQMLKEHL